MAPGSRQDLKDRTLSFALRILKLHAALPKTRVAQVMGDQLVRSGTSVGAHYREAMRGKSDADFISKLEGGLQELEETAYWLELLAKSNLVKPQRLELLIRETDELTAILVSIVKKVKDRRKRP